MDKFEMSTRDLPKLLDGAGFGIVENVGGAKGLKKFVSAVKKGEGEKFAHLFKGREEILENFDITKMGQGDINPKFKKMIKYYKDVYEFGEPRRPLREVGQKKQPGTHEVLTINAYLKDFEPKIWRKFQVPQKKSVAELGYMLMIMFEMTPEHEFRFLHEITMKDMNRFLDSVRDEMKNCIKTPEDLGIKSRTFFTVRPPDCDYFDDDEEEGDKLANEYEMGSVMTWGNATFEYDFGDGWEIALELECVENMEKSLKELPRVLDGEGFGIVGSVGGVMGLEKFVKAVKKGKGRDFENFKEWFEALGKDIADFDMSKMDKDDLNFRLKKLVRVYRECYEHDLCPTKKSIDLIERKYMK